MIQTQQDNFDQMIEQIVLSSPPSVLVKARQVGATYWSFVNVDHIPSDYEVMEPKQYKVYFSPNNTEVQSF